MTMNLMAGVPTHSGNIVSEGVVTLLAAQAIAHERGGVFEISFTSGATISIVRNAIISDFIASGADALLMLDADQSVDRSTLERMIDLNQPIVGCLYPRRAYEWAHVAPSKGSFDIQQICSQALRFVGEVEADAQGSFSVTDGFARAKHLGTGVMLLRRTAINEMMARYPQLEGKGYPPEAYPKQTNNWGFFNPIESSAGYPVSEDLSFCRRWKDIGGELWAEVSSPATHVGRHAFVGAYLDHLQSFE